MSLVFTGEVTDAQLAWIFQVLWEEDERLLSTWVNTSRHPLQEDEPGGDRHWVTSSPVLQVRETDTGSHPAPYCR